MNKYEERLKNKYDINSSIQFRPILTKLTLHLCICRKALSPSKFNRTAIKEGRMFSFGELVGVRPPLWLCVCAAQGKPLSRILWSLHSPVGCRLNSTASLQSSPSIQFQQRATCVFERGAAVSRTYYRRRRGFPWKNIKIYYFESYIVSCIVIFTIILFNIR
jgi:hypothetical protein